MCPEPGERSHSCFLFIYLRKLTINCIRVCSQALQHRGWGHVTRWPLLSVWAVGQEGCIPCSSSRSSPYWGPIFQRWGHERKLQLLHPARLTWKGLASLGDPTHPSDWCRGAFFVTSSTVYFLWVKPVLWPVRKASITATSLERAMNSPSGPILIVCRDGETASVNVGGTWERPKVSGE